jgi:hypothetical protein
VSFTPTHKLLLMTNYKPHADARDQAFLSRACLLEFGMRFVAHPKAPNERQADPSLKEQLREERSGILAWLVRGCLAFQELGLAILSPTSFATEKYREEEDTILHFLNECCVLRPEVSVKANALYEAYKAWCEENQFGRGMNATLFGNEIGRRFEKKRGNTGMIYQGVQVLTTQEQSVGGVYTPSTSAMGDDRPLEASSKACEEEGSVGCVGFGQVFPQNTIESHYKGQNREKPYTLNNITRRMGGIRAMMLTLLLSELARLQIRLSVASDGLHVQAPVGALCDELRLAMSEHKTALMRYASLPYVIADDVVILTGNRQEQDMTLVAPLRKASLALQNWRHESR